jgi:2-polyprenyl-3-methyl-5-hydroxy-6-metoxy-1,4-benzoquinol methylase
MLSPVDELNRRLYERYTSTHVGPSNVSHAIPPERAPYLDQLVKRHFPDHPSAAILELGCGTGSLLALLQQRGFHHVSGVDTSPEQVALAHAWGLSCVRMGGLLEELSSQPSSSLDVVVAFDVLEHLDKPTILRVSDEVLRVLRPEGRFIFHVPNGNGIFPGATYFGDLSHQTCFTERSIQQLISVTGFGSVDVFEDVPTVHGVFSGVRWALWKAVRFSVRFAHGIETGDLRSKMVLSRNILAVAKK